MIPEDDKTYQRLADIGYRIAEKHGASFYCLSENGAPYVFDENEAGRALNHNLIKKVCFRLTAKEFAKLDKPAKFIYNLFKNEQ